MTPALQLEILDLRHFSAASLRPLLEAEAKVWADLCQMLMASNAFLYVE